MRGEGLRSQVSAKAEDLTEPGSVTAAEHTSVLPSLQTVFEFNLLSWRLIYRPEVGHKAADNRADSNSHDGARYHVLSPGLANPIIPVIDDTPIHGACSCADSDPEQQMTPAPPANTHASYIVAVNRGSAALFIQSNVISIRRYKCPRDCLAIAFDDTNLVAWLQRFQVFPGIAAALAPRET